jgi:hypothetical protein
VDGEFSGGFASWSASPDLLVNISRMLASEATVLEVKSRSELRRGMARVHFEFEPELARSLQAQPLSVRVISPPGQEPLTVPVEWEGPDCAVARFSLDALGHYLPVLDMGETGVAKAPPITLPYSPEFAPSSAGLGEPVLAELAERTGGALMGEPSALFDPSGLTARKSRLDVSAWVLGALVILLLLEIAERRTGLTGMLVRRLPLGRAGRAIAGAGRLLRNAAAASIGRKARPSTHKPQEQQEPGDEPQAGTETEPSQTEETPEDGVESVLRNIKHRKR